MAAHYQVYDLHAVTCRLTAKYRISSVPQHLTYEYGTYLYFYKYENNVYRLL